MVIDLFQAEMNHDLCKDSKLMVMITQCMAYAKSSRSPVSVATAIN